ncbi:MAG: TonB C-terminal domain-containing protein [Candidatus Adiutrix sp.]|jgi:outer membrane biosynthesis protein TonB|nr:TonB C-terminal domain-containing protein [Candidatus Adiutrix sp.]
MATYQESRNGESTLAAAFFLSAGLHVLLGGFLLFFLPHLMESRKTGPGEVITVQLLGGLSPPAPAAPPALVDPDLKGPDVVEAPPGDPAPSQPAPPVPSALSAPPEVIPLGPKAPEKPVLRKTPVTPPPVTPPQVKADPPPRPKPNNDAEIKRRMEALRRKTEAEQTEAEINSRLVNLRERLGQGQGESSEAGGGASEGQRVHPEEAAYYQQVHDIVKYNWIPPAGTMSANIKAIFEIKIEPGGGRAIARLVTASGHPDFDLSVQRAIGISNLPPLPPIFEGRAAMLRVVFNPDALRR